MQSGSPREPLFCFLIFVHRIFSFCYFVMVSKHEPSNQGFMWWEKAHIDLCSPRTFKTNMSQLQLRLALRQCHPLGSLSSFTDRTSWSKKAQESRQKIAVEMVTTHVGFFMQVVHSGQVVHFSFSYFPAVSQTECR